MAYQLKNRLAKKLSFRTLADFHRERMILGQKVGLVNLGCARNLVDAQVMLAQLKKDGNRIVDLNQAEVAIVNTCAFIEEAKRESIDAILDLIELKKQGKLKKVIVAGCLAQRYGHELAKELKEVDAFVGITRLNRTEVPEQVSLTPSHFAYVKICESCFNSCSFCAIPGIKGKFVSRVMDSILKEIHLLDQRGVKEINIIGQDITAYGMDIYREKRLAQLLREIAKATRQIQWIRLLYTFPAHVTDELIDVMAQEEKVCKYIDIPLQHISNHLLKSMNRHITKQETISLLNKIRSRIPGGVIRTTFIVGLPGEREEDFCELQQFLQDFQFERVGVFVYSREEDTPAYHFSPQVSEQTKKKRMNILMKDQQKISREALKGFIGQRLQVLIEEQVTEEANTYLGRSQYDAPEVDGLVYVHSHQDLKPGDFVPVAITDAYEYDLVGEVE